MEELWVPSLVPAARGRPKNASLVRFEDISSSSEEDEEGDQQINIDEFTQNVDTYFSSLPPDADLLLPRSEPTDFARLMEPLSTAHPTTPVQVNIPSVLHTESTPSQEERTRAQELYDEMRKKRQKKEKAEQLEMEMMAVFYYGVFAGVLVTAGTVFAYYMFTKKSPAVTEAATQAAAQPRPVPIPRVRPPPTMPAYY